MTSAPAGRRLAALDSLRALAALAVVAYHYTFGFEEIVGKHSRPVPNFVFGHFGVELFFIISGFVIAWTLERSASIYDFGVSRLARLYPAYLAAMAVTAILIFGAGFNPQHLAPFVIASNLIIGLPPLINGANIDPSYWTLGLEVAFYTLAAAVTFGLPRLRMEAWCLIWMAASLAIQLFLRTHVRLQLLTVSGFSELFVLGATTFKLLEAKRPSPLTIFTWTAALAFSFVGFGAGGAVELHPRYGLMIAVFAVAVGFAARDLIPPLRFKPLVAIGQASYSLYLIHQILGYWIILHLEAMGLSPWLAIGAASLAAVAIALVLRRFVEVPGQRMVRSLLGLKRAPPVMPEQAVSAAG